VTRGGVHTNVSVGIQYLAAWLSGTGAAAINNLMEDVATAEISRSQLWQWIHHGVKTSDGEPVTESLVRSIAGSVVDSLEVGDHPTHDRLSDARKVFEEVDPARLRADQLVLCPLTLARLRASQGRRWQGRRTQSHWAVRQGRGRSQRCHLAVLRAANVCGRSISNRT
jgi:malate synthase